MLLVLLFFYLFSSCLPLPLGESVARAGAGCPMAWRGG